MWNSQVFRNHLAPKLEGPGNQVTDYLCWPLFKKGLSLVSSLPSVSTLAKIDPQDAVMSEQKKKLVAYHEAGHAILGALMSLGRRGCVCVVTTMIRPSQQL